jgi:hypothetical protein
MTLPSGRGGDVDAFLRAAIEGHRLISFKLDGRARVAEPHDYGLVDGVARLLFFQVGGESRSGHPIGWRCPAVAKIADLELLERRFAGTRSTPTGRHKRWDRIIATVTKRPDPSGRVA